MVLSRVFSSFCIDKDSRAKAIVVGTAIEAGSIGFLSAQIPGDRFAIGGLQIEMVMDIARVYGKRFDRATALGLAKASVATALGPEAVNQVLKYIPILGNISNLSVASSVTAIIGYTSIKMIRDGSWFEQSKKELENAT